MTEELFARHGAWTFSIARFVPVARHFISIPAGVARMRLPVFILQRMLAATVIAFGWIRKRRAAQRAGSATAATQVPSAAE
ncbi:MAG: hypothetical protein K8M05_31535 [Deltaproteobacteria bacterium]|nr:hypothetical protein [Kofleriaceae bacterium]